MLTFFHFRELTLRNCPGNTKVTQEHLKHGIIAGCESAGPTRDHPLGGRRPEQ